MCNLLETSKPQELAENPDAANSGGGVHPLRAEIQNASPPHSLVQEDNAQLNSDLNADDSVEDEVWDDTEMAQLEAKFYTAPTVEMNTQAISLVMTAASVVAFMSPGTAVFLGKPRLYASAMNLVISTSVLLISFLSVCLGFFPVPLFAALFVFVLVFWGIGFFHTLTCKLPNIQAIEPWVQAGLAILTFWFPFICAFYMSSDFFLQQTWMSNDTMKPGIVRGDLILVDKQAFTWDAPDYGDLAFIEEAYTDNGVVRKRAYFGRVIAKPGDSVQLHGVRPSVNGQSLSQYHLRTENSVFDRNILTYELPHGMEANATLDEPARWYPIWAPNQLLFSQTNTITLEPDYYYVFEDNRESKRERVRSTYGSIVHRDEIKGMPRYVIYNTESDMPLERYGLHLR